MEQKIKERPIIFNAEMVRAILAGRKTQTRRALKNQENYLSWNCATRVFESDYLRELLPGADESSFVLQDNSGELVDSKWQPVSCPLGKIGDQLWGREAFSAMGNNEGHALPIFYRADGEDGNKWTPSIHMPRWASRIQLEITNIRLERINLISEQDAIAEGVEKSEWKYSCEPYRNYHHPRMAPGHNCSIARASFMTLWQKIYGMESWKQNPWVWVIEFKRLTP